MKAAVLHKVDAPLSIENFEMPTIARDEVLIKVKACGVCHTDIKVIEGPIQSRVPTIIGHEVPGTIEEVGSTQRNAFKFSMTALRSTATEGQLDELLKVSASCGAPNMAMKHSALVPSLLQGHNSSTRYRE